MSRNDKLLILEFILNLAALVMTVIAIIDALQWGNLEFVLIFVVTGIFVGLSFARTISEFRGRKK